MDDGFILLLHSGCTLGPIPPSKVPAMIRSFVVSRFRSASGSIPIPIPTMRFSSAEKGSDRFVVQAATASSNNDAFDESDALETAKAIGVQHDGEDENGNGNESGKNKDIGTIVAENDERKVVTKNPQTIAEESNFSDEFDESDSIETGKQK